MGMPLEVELNCGEKSTKKHSEFVNFLRQRVARASCEWRGSLGRWRGLMRCPSDAAPGIGRG